MATKRDEQSNSGDQGTGVQPARRKAPKAGKPRQMPPWKVILHNDDVHTMDEVVKRIRQLTPLTEEQAIQRMLEAHKTGCAMLLVTHQERAELYVEQFATYKLTVTAEPDA